MVTKVAYFGRIIGIVGFQFIGGDCFLWFLLVTILYIKHSSTSLLLPIYKVAIFSNLQISPTKLIQA
jgi:hypothetical protein